jgi:hypothetical protein
VISRAWRKGARTCTLVARQQLQQLQLMSIEGIRLSTLKSQRHAYTYVRAHDPLTLRELRRLSIRVSTSLTSGHGAYAIRPHSDFHACSSS